MTTEIDKRAQLLYARNEGTRIGMERGMRLGKREGRKEGMELGLANGFSKGIEQANKETARRMKAADIPTETISQCTGLSLEQIAEL